jgi:SAM-dependent methyltransferase
MSDQQGFFDDYPEFYDSATHLGPKRLNMQYHAIIGANADAIRGKRILDLACHNGHWSYAAAMMGAAHITGVEGRPEQVDLGNKAMAKHSIPADKYTFIVGDIPTSLKEFKAGQFDTIFCLGFLYHTMHHMAVIGRIGDLRPETIVIDSGVTADRYPVVRLSEEDPGHKGNAIAGDYGSGGRVLVGTPSRAALKLMLEHAGYPDIVWFDWYGQAIKNWDHLEEYRDGTRLTLRATRAGA